MRKENNVVCSTVSGEKGELTHSLDRAKAELEKAKRLSDIGMLVVTIAHELRNPLAAISFAVYNIKQKIKDADAEKYLLNIEKKLAESDQIINNLLFYSRVKSPQPDTIKIKDVIEECVEITAKRSKYGVIIDKQLDSINDFRVEADPVQMRMVFSNLLNNALDAMEGKSGKIEVIANTTPRRLKVLIKDQGAGISDEDIPKIFEAFFTTKSKGTGLGLAVCKHLISLHEGDITIQSKKNIGTTVVITLPRKIPRTTGQHTAYQLK